MAFNRELSQFANYLDLDASANYIGIAGADSAEVGIGTTATDAKLTVGGDVKVSGAITATSFSGSFSGTLIEPLLETEVTGLGGDLRVPLLSTELETSPSLQQSEQTQSLLVMTQLVTMLPLLLMLVL